MIAALLAFSLSAASAASAAAAAPRPPAGSIPAIDSLVRDAISRGELPGAVVLVGHNKKVVFRRAYGNRAVLPRVEAMTPDTIFDLASLTKVVATAPSILMLVEEGKIRLADPVVRVLPDFAAGADGAERARITIDELLTHRAGFPPDAMRVSPFAENARERMRSALPGRRCTMPVPSARCRSTSRFPPTARSLPSGEKRREVRTGGW